MARTLPPALRARTAWMTPRLRAYIAQGLRAPDAMRRAAADWREARDRGELRFTNNPRHGGRRRKNPGDDKYEPGELVRVKSLGGMPGNVQQRVKAGKKGFLGLVGGSDPKYSVYTAEGARMTVPEGSLSRFNPTWLGLPVTFVLAVLVWGFVERQNGAKA